MVISTLSSRRVAVIVALLIVQALTFLMVFGVLISALSWTGPEADSAIYIVVAVLLATELLSVIQAIAVLRRQHLSLVHRVSMVLGGLSLAATTFIGVSGALQRHPATIALTVLGIIMATPPLLVLRAMSAASPDTRRSH